MAPKKNETGIGPAHSPARREPLTPLDRPQTLFAPMPVSFAPRHQPATRTPAHPRLEPLKTTGHAPRVESGAAGLSGLLQVSPLRHRALAPLSRPSAALSPTPDLMSAVESRATPVPPARSSVPALAPLSVPVRSSVVSAHQAMAMFPTPAPSPMGALENLAPPAPLARPTAPTLSAMPMHSGAASEPPGIAEAMLTHPGLVYGVHEKPKGVRGFGMDRKEILARVGMVERAQGLEPLSAPRTVDALNKEMGMLAVDTAQPTHVLSTPARSSSELAQLSPMARTHYEHQSRVMGALAGATPATDPLVEETAIKRNNRAALTSGIPIHFNLDGLTAGSIRSGVHQPGYTDSEARFVARNAQRLPDVNFYQQGRPVSPTTASTQLGGIQSPDSPRPASPTAHLDKHYFPPKSPGGSSTS